MREISRDNILRAISGDQIMRVLSKENFRNLSPRQLFQFNTANPVHPSIGTTGTLYLLYSYTIELIWWLRAPGIWCWQLLRLIVFTLLMLPGFIPVFIHYLTSSSVQKNIPYGKRFRQQLDVYLPYKPSNREEGKKYPVVIFITGGAWIIGYKVWGFIMGQLLQKNGIICVSSDYRNFPQASVGNMLDDIEDSIEWVKRNIIRYGGDLDQVTLVGQSAGAHLSALALLKRMTTSEDNLRGNWDFTLIKHWIGISGPYDIERLIPALSSRGLHKRVLRALFDDLENQSPLQYLKRYKEKIDSKKKPSFPKMHLYHGTCDATVSCDHSEEFAAALLDAGIESTVTLFRGKSHTDPILEDPVSGPDPLMNDLLKVVSKVSEPPKTLQHYQPKIMLKIAKW
eukprot:CAMPEP_0114531190 /NCGR_PEP_ID=MMETSP0109-20121206/25916_1 /TAXON_ID=29199 /ORGANISM="Chlorarachnion reptans, Strain CCCM449" /LENGTH=396 /DNA_ID=CAMNT_0001714003 /DNA_START=330 /DNA_END=1517 /DNA_ORIENTATION=+